MIRSILDYNEQLDKKSYYACLHLNLQPLGIERVCEGKTQQLGKECNKQERLSSRFLIWAGAWVGPLSIRALIQTSRLFFTASGTVNRIQKEDKQFPLVSISLVMVWKSFTNETDVRGYALPQRILSKRWDHKTQ